MTTSDGVRLHVEVAGRADAAVTVVLIHGWAMSTRFWADQMLPLSRHAKVVAYDHRGHGNSTCRLKKPPTSEQLAADLHTVIEEFAPSGPVVLAGHSMGGMAIMSLAASRPELFRDRIAGVALINTSAGHLHKFSLGLAGPSRMVARGVAHGAMAAARRMPYAADRVRRLAKPDGRAMPQLVGTFVCGPSASEMAVARCIELINTCPSSTAGIYFPTLMAHDQHQALEVLGGVPVVVMAGVNDRLTPVEHGRLIASEIPGATLVEVPGAGHMIPVEHPHLVIDAVRGLVGRSAVVAA